MARRRQRPRSTPTTCFETFPLPWPPGQEPWRDERLHAIANAARALDEQRRAYLDPPDATDAELKKRTLTTLYNERPAWLDHAHAALDRAVWAAYGWDDPEPAAVPEDVVLTRLLALNQNRAGWELAQVTGLPAAPIRRAHGGSRDVGTAGRKAHPRRCSQRSR